MAYHGVAMHAPDGVDLGRVEEFSDKREHVDLKVGRRIEDVVESHVEAGQGKVLLGKQHHQL